VGGPPLKSGRACLSHTSCAANVSAAAFTRQLALACDILCVVEKAGWVAATAAVVLQLTQAHHGVQTAPQPHIMQPSSQSWAVTIRGLFTPSIWMSHAVWLRITSTQSALLPLRAGCGYCVDRCP
jgi:hypothetical protein